MTKKITCHEYTGVTFCGFMCLVAILIPGLTIYQHFVFGSLNAQQWGWSIGVTVFIVAGMACLWRLPSKRSFRFSGMTLELLRGERIVQQWNLESCEFRIRRRGIMINRKPLSILLPNHGRAFKIITRRLILLAQQGHTRMEPKPTLGWRENLQLVIAMVLWLCLRIVTFVPLLFGVMTVHILFLDAYCPETCTSRDKASFCLLITMATYALLSYVFRKRIKVFEMCVFNFLGRILGAKKNEAFPPCSTETHTRS